MSNEREMPTLWGRDDDAGWPEVVIVLVQAEAVAGPRLVAQHPLVSLLLQLDKTLLKSFLFSPGQAITASLPFTFAK